MRAIAVISLIYSALTLLIGIGIAAQVKDINAVGAIITKSLLVASLLFVILSIATTYLAAI